MYRRNISNILYPIAGVLGLFIVYEAVLKPVYIQTPPPTPIDHNSPIDRTDRIADQAYEPPPEEAPAPAQKQLRVIDAGGVPDTKHRRPLEAIREEIEKGNLKTAEAQLHDLPEAVQADARTRSYIAILWNNLGIEQEKLEGTKGSLKAFNKAASLDPNNPVILMNLAHGHWDQRDPGMNQDFLEPLIALAPQDPFPHVALADWLQEHGRLGEAARHLDQGAQRSADDTSAQSYLR